MQFIKTPTLLILIIKQQTLGLDFGNFPVDICEFSVPVARFVSRMALLSIASPRRVYEPPPGGPLLELKMEEVSLNDSNLYQ